MTLIHLLVLLVVIGLLYWAVTSIVPMEPPIIRKTVNVIVVLAVCFLILDAFGLLANFPNPRIGR